MLQQNPLLAVAGVPDWHWVLVGCGFSLIVVAVLWLAVSRRARIESEDGGSPERRFSTPTRLVIGLAFAVSGYHLVSWFMPSAWAPPGVPIGRWWGLVLIVALLVLVSVAMDRAERRRNCPTRSEDDQTRDA